MLSTPESKYNSTEKLDTYWLILKPTPSYTWDFNVKLKIVVR